MLTIDQLKGLEKGDVVETVPLMPGVTDTPLSLRVKNTQADPLEVQFVTTWHGVTLGSWVASEAKGTVTWKI